MPVLPDKNDKNIKLIKILDYIYPDIQFNLLT